MDSDPGIFLLWLMCQAELRKTKPRMNVFRRTRAPAVFEQTEKFEENFFIRETRLESMLCFPNWTLHRKKVGKQMSTWWGYLEGSSPGCDICLQVGPHLF